MSANVRSSARKSGKRRVASASSDDAERHVGEVVALGHDLGAEQDAARARARTPPARPRPRRARRRCRRRGGRPGSRAPRASRRARARRRSVPAPWRATPGEPQLGQRVGAGSRWPQWWQATSPAARCRTSATSHCGHSHTRPQTAAAEEVRPAAAVQQHDRLLTVAPHGVQRLGGVGVQRVGGVAHVEHPHRRQRAAVDARGQHERARAGARSRAAASPTRPRAPRRPGARAARRPCARRSAGRPRACRRRPAPRRPRSGRGR